eukprot:3932497-Rhodomonas_salina.1
MAYGGVFRARCGGGTGRNEVACSYRPTRCALRGMSCAVSGTDIAYAATSYWGLPFPMDVVKSKIQT